MQTASHDSQAPDLVELCELLAGIIGEELAAIGPKEDLGVHDEARMKSALSCLKALKELEDMKARAALQQGEEADDGEDILEFRERLQKRMEALVAAGEVE